MSRYVQLFIGWDRHPKFKHFLRLLGVSRLEAKGLFTGWLTWVGEFAVDGLLASFTDDQIEAEAEWGGERGRFVASLIESRFLEETPDGLYVHEWIEEYAKGLRIADEKREARARAKVRAAERALGRRAGLDSPDSQSSSTTGESSSRKEKRGDDLKRDEMKEQSAPSAPPTSPPLLVLMEGGEVVLEVETTEGVAWPLTKRKLAQLQEAYPGRDVLAEARKWSAKLAPLPSKRCVSSLSSWLSRIDLYAKPQAAPSARASPPRPESDRHNKCAHGALTWCECAPCGRVRPRQEAPA